MSAHAQLIPMANRIAQFFATQPTPPAQHEAVAEHLRMFWAPSMRQALIEYVDGLEANTATQTDVALHALVIEAVQRCRAALLPAQA